MSATHHAYGDEQVSFIHRLAAKYPLIRERHQHDSGVYNLKEESQRFENFLPA
nr:hypothetical protein [Bradyrhizobium canariense]